MEASHTATVGAPGPPRPAEAVASGHVLAGRFVLGRRLGDGASGVVFAATDITLGQQVAVKVLRAELMTPAALERVRREVRIARDAHPALARVYDLHEGDGHVLLSMELVEGVSLRERLHGGRRLDEEATVRIACDIAAALAHLHGHGIVHRDVKPGNILLTPDGGAKLCDLGLARPLEHGHTVTVGEVALGTPAYMAPEQARGGELSPAADVYALGLTLYRCLTGEVPLCDSSAISTLTRRCRERARRARRVARDVPRWLDRLLAWMLEPNPRRRPASDVVVRILERRSIPIRVPWRRVAALAAIVALAVGGGWWYREHRRGATVAVDAVAEEVVGIDDRGRPTWRQRLPGTGLEILKGDLDGDGVDEVVAWAQPAAQHLRMRRPVGPEVVILRRDGRLVSRLRPEPLVTWEYPYPVQLKPLVTLVDLDGDALPEVVAQMRHLNYYPSVLFVYRHAEHRWLHALVHPGHIHDVIGAESGGAAGVRFIGVNNRLGLTMVVGLLRLPPHTGATWSGRRKHALPAELATPQAELEDYVFLPLELGAGSRGSMVGNEIVASADGGTRCRVGDRELELDRWGNLADGPNAGLDLRDQRLHLLASLGALASDHPSDRAVIEARAATMMAQFHEVLREPVYQALSDAQVGRVLARAGHQREAIARLEAAVARMPFEDLRMRLANVLAVAGELPRAEHMLAAMIEDPATVRGSFDAILLQHRVLTARFDEEGLRRRLRPPGFGAEREPFVAAALARAHLYWDRVTEADRRVVSMARCPGGDAVACLARWRSGHLAPDDIEAIGRSIEANPDAAYEGRLALAAAQLGLGRAGDALVTIEALVADLSEIAGDDFALTQTARLAGALRAAILLANDADEQAAAAAGALASRLDPNLLPGILVREVQAQLASSDQNGVVAAGKVR